MNPFKDAVFKAALFKANIKDSTVCGSVQRWNFNLL